MFLTSVSNKRRKMNGVPNFKIHQFCSDSCLLGLKCSWNLSWHKVFIGFRILFWVLRHWSTTESRRDVYMIMKNYSAYPNNDNRAKLLIKKGKILLLFVNNNKRWKQFSQYGIEKDSWHIRIGSLCTQTFWNQNKHEHLSIRKCLFRTRVL